MSNHMRKTYTLEYIVCGVGRRFVNTGKKPIIRDLKSKGWTLDRATGWTCGKCNRKED